jgi:hypothetical protein
MHKSPIVDDDEAMLDIKRLVRLLSQPPTLRATFIRAGRKQTGQGVLADEKPFR